MPRPDEQEKITAALDEYLAIAVMRPPETCPLNIASVARAIGHSRTTLYHYGLDARIREAAQRQGEHERAGPKKRERLAYTDIIREQDAKIARLDAQVVGLIAQINIMEGNAERLGIRDSEELYKPLARPDRSASRAGRGRAKVGG